MIMAQETTFTEDGYHPDLVETGERIMESPVTDTTYCVTKWVDKGDGRVVALEKEPIDEGDDE